MEGASVASGAADDAPLPSIFSLLWPKFFKEHTSHTVIKLLIICLCWPAVICVLSCEVAWTLFFKALDQIPTLVGLCYHHVFLPAAYGAWSAVWLCSSRVLLPVLKWTQQSLQHTLHTLSRTLHTLTHTLWRRCVRIVRALQALFTTHITPHVPLRVMSASCVCVDIYAHVATLALDVMQVLHHLTIRPLTHACSLLYTFTRTLLHTAVSGVLRAVKRKGGALVVRMRASVWGWVCDWACFATQKVWHPLIRGYRVVLRRTWRRVIVPLNTWVFSSILQPTCLRTLAVGRCIGNTLITRPMQFQLQLIQRVCYGVLRLVGLSGGTPQGTSAPVSHTHARHDGQSEADVRADRTSDDGAETRESEGGRGVCDCAGGGESISKGPHDTGAKGSGVGVVEVDEPPAERAAAHDCGGHVPPAAEQKPTTNDVMKHDADPADDTAKDAAADLSSGDGTGGVTGAGARCASRAVASCAVHGAAEGGREGDSHTKKSSLLPNHEQELGGAVAVRVAAGEVV